MNGALIEIDDRLAGEREIFERHTHGKVIEAIAIEVGGGQRGAEAVSGFRIVRNTAAALTHHRLVEDGDASGGCAKDLNGAGIDDRTGVLAGNTDGEVG